VTNAVGPAVVTAEQLPTRPVVHLELHTPDQVRASAFYAELLSWRSRVVRTAAGSYLALDSGAQLGGGVVECCTRRPLWLPYVEVDRIDATGNRMSFPFGARPGGSLRLSGTPLLRVVTVADIRCPFTERVAVKVRG
jgi:hypothetical protein